MHDAMRHAAQRQLEPVGERDRLRQALQPRRDPAAVALREGACLAHDAAQRHGEHDRAGRRLHAQRIAPRLARAGAARPDRPRRRTRSRSPAARAGRRNRSARSDIGESQESREYISMLESGRDGRGERRSRMPLRGFRDDGGRQASASALRRAPLPRPLCDSTKSEMRGAISERKREPLNTP